MKNFFKSDFLKILFALCFVAAGVFVLNFVSAGNIINSAVSAFMCPVQQLANAVSSIASESLKKKETEQSYKDQIRDLKKEIRKLRTLTADYYDAKRENAQYLKFYKIKKADKTLEFKTATIVSKDANDAFLSFTLNKGFLSGIEKNAPVITESGIIGRVENVSQNTCKVVTIFSKDFKASAISANSGDAGIISGNAKLLKDKLVGMFYLSAQNNIKPEDIIVTSSIGGMYPKNMPIGKVKELRQDDFDSSFYAAVEPFADFNAINEVLILTNFDGKER